MKCHFIKIQNSNEWKHKTHQMRYHPRERHFELFQHKLFPVRDSPPPTLSTSPPGRQHKRHLAPFGNFVVPFVEARARTKIYGFLTRLHSIHHGGGPSLLCTPFQGAPQCVRSRDRGNSRGDRTKP
ncbi:hypothetical protein CDAR_533231 [Caerostris darwini]|uniref:Uncharacterized protein n=1 Tax=Caerostris darwini TaxID=1538125 RepID=A0AAV4NAM7_9ARAC|nr:hypothetical protein CDAR_533231 [Caerostris darwini]